MLGFQEKKTTKCFSPHFLRPKFMADFDKASLTVPFQKKKHLSIEGVRSLGHLFVQLLHLGWPKRREAVAYSDDIS